MKLIEKEKYIMYQTRISGLYKLTNIINNKVYIGESLDIERRINNEHLISLKNNCHYNNMLQNEFNTYGEENFKHELLQRFESETPFKTKACLIILEDWYIKHYQEQGYILYNQEYTLDKILCDEKHLIENSNKDAYLIIDLLKKYKINLIDGVPVFIERNTKQKVFSMIDGKEKIGSHIKEKYETTYNQFIKENNDTVIIKKYEVKANILKSGVFIIEEFTDEGLDMFKAYIGLEAKPIIKKQSSKVKSTNCKNYSDIKYNDLIAFTAYLSMLTQINLLPIRYDYFKLRDYLSENNIIYVKYIGGSTRTFATDHALENNMLIINKTQVEDGITTYTYHITGYGRECIENILKNIPEGIRNDMFSMKLI